MSRELARAISALERGEHPAFDASKRPALTIGITGPPGAGKSTVIDALLGVLSTEGEKVGVLAVDPSSPFTGGALLGDRVRMQNLGANVFFRSLASHSQGGGLSPITASALSLLAADGYQTVLIESVGVGQEQIDIARLADVTAVVLTPGLGDSIQAEKAGILEAASLIILNKCDLQGADVLEQQLHEATGLPIVRMTARDGIGAAEALAHIRGSERRRLAAVHGFTLDHMGIAVPSIELALAFYQAQLGMSVTHRETVDIEKVHVAMLDLGPSRLELLEPAAPDSPISKFLEKRGPGIHHIALRVPDFEQAIAKLKSSGARLLNEPRRGAGGHKYVFIHPASTGGVLLELIEHVHP